MDEVMENLEVEPDVETEVETEVETAPEPEVEKIAVGDSEYTQEELSALIEKGRGMDDIQGKLDSYKGSVDAIDRIAHKMGKTTEQYLKDLDSHEHQRKVEETMSQYNCGEEEAKKLLSAFELAEKTEKQEKQASFQASLDSEINEANEMFKDHLGREIDLENDLSEESYREWYEKGTPLKYVMAYEKWNSMKEDLEQKIIADLDKKKESSTGSINTSGGGDTSGYSADDIMNMSDEEYKKIFM